MTFLLFLLSVFACYRLSHLFAGELGPANLFKKMRGLFSPKTNMGKGIRCALCLSIWFAFLITAYLGWLGEVSWKLAPVYAFAVSGAAVLIHKLDD